MTGYVDQYLTTRCSVEPGDPAEAVDPQPRPGEGMFFQTAGPEPAAPPAGPGSKPQTTTGATP